mgnify:CR=1 FL=1
MIVHQERNVFSLVASSQSVGKTGQNNATVEEFAWNVMICQTRRCLEAAALARWSPRNIMVRLSSWKSSSSNMSGIYVFPLQEAGVTSRTSNFRRCSREQYLSCFQAISRRFWGGLRFVLLVGFCTKRRPWPNSLKSANIIVPRFCFRLESCWIYFQAISRRFWRGLRFWIFGLRFALLWLASGLDFQDTLCPAVPYFLNFESICAE